MAPARAVAGIVVPRTIVQPRAAAASTASGIVLPSRPAYAPLILADGPTAYWRLGDLGKNLLTNPGFEAGFAGWTKPDNAWALDAAVKRSGAQSARIAVAYYDYLYQSPVLPLGTYVFSGYAKTSADFTAQNGQGVEVEAGTSSNVYGSHGPQLVAGQDWTRTWRVFTITAQGAPNLIVCNTYGGVGTGTVWWDEMQLEAAPAATAYESVLYSLAADSSGNGRDGTVSREVVKEVAGPIGDGGFAMTFDGTSRPGVPGAVSIPYAAALDSPSVTVEAWVKLIAGSQGGVFEKTIGGNVNTAYLLFIESQRPNWRIATPALWTLQHSGLVLAYGTWYHFAGTYDGTTQRFYSNGNQIVTSQVVGAPMSTGVGVSLIGVLGNTIYQLAGSVGEVAVYPYALTPAQVLARWLGGPPKTGSQLTPSVGTGSTATASVGVAVL